MATRWAICGAGQIANDFCLALKSLPASEHQIVCVAASKKERAADFAARFDIPTSYGSYDDLAQQDDIDIIYIAVVHALHVDLSLKYINAGKNVLCEKPISYTLDGCRRVLAAAKEKGVFFAEGFWTRYFPAMSTIQEQITSGKLGKVRMIEASFQFPSPNGTLAEGSSKLLPIGCYPVMAINMIFKGKPEKIVAHLNRNESGADISGVIILEYSGQRTACLTYGSETEFGFSYLTVRGSKGNLQVPDYMWCPSKVILNDGQLIEHPLPEVKGKMNYPRGQGFVYQAQGTRECLLHGLKESPKIPHEDSESIMYIIDESFKQMGMKFSFP